MAVVKVSILGFNGDPLTSAALAFYALGLLITLVQCGQAARVVHNPANASRRGIFGSVLGSVVCLAISYGFHIGQLVILNNNGTLANNERVWAAFYAIDIFTRIAALVLIYLSILLALYHRVTIYVGPSSQLWFIKKIVDGVFFGLWVLMYIVEVAWILAGYVGYFVNHTMTGDQYVLRNSTNRSLDSANAAFYILVHVAAIVAVVMVNSASKNAQDSVVRTMMRAMLPILAFRTIWNIANVSIYSASPPVIRTPYQSEGLSLAFAIIEPLSLAILIGIMIHLGTQHAFWGAPVPLAARPGFAPQQPYGTQGMVGGPQGMTMLIGPNGLPVLGPNGQPLFTPVGPEPAQGLDSASLEAWKHQSMYSPTSTSPTTNSNSISPMYQQQNFLPYGQFVPQQQQFVAPQQNQFAHLPQPPDGYSYQPPAVNAQAPKPGSQVSLPLPPLPAGAQGGPGQPRASLDPSSQPNV